MHTIPLVPNYVMGGSDWDKELQLIATSQKIHQLLDATTSPDAIAPSISFSLNFIFSNPSNRIEKPSLCANFFKSCYFWGAEHLNQPRNLYLLQNYHAIPDQGDTKLFRTLFVLTAFFSLIKNDIALGIVKIEALHEHQGYPIKFPDGNVILIIQLLGYLEDFLKQPPLNPGLRKIQRAKSYQPTRFQRKTDFFDLVSLYNHYAREGKLQLFHHYLDLAMFIEPPIAKPLLPLVPPLPSAPSVAVHHPVAGTGSINADSTPGTPLIGARTRCGRCWPRSCFCPGCVVS